MSMKMLCSMYVPAPMSESMVCMSKSVVCMMQNYTTALDASHTTRYNNIQHTP